MTTAAPAAWDLWPRLRTSLDGDRRLVVDLDGWPLVSVDLPAAAVAVNDLRRRVMFSHVVAIDLLGNRPLAQLVPTIDGEGTVVVHHGSILNPAVCIAIAATPADAVHAEVRMATVAEGVIWCRTVRYRQLPSTRPLAPPNDHHQGASR
ncbi:MAG: hypothetical protein ACLGIO_00760 [Acidimicrobiia bacterium]